MIQNSLVCKGHHLPDTTLKHHLSTCPIQAASGKVRLHRLFVLIHNRVHAISGNLQSFLVFTILSGLSTPRTSALKALSAIPKQA